jgi:hypothetical protein
MAALNTVYIRNPDAQSHRMKNDTGAQLEENELTVIGTMVGVAAEVIANAATGGFDTEDGAIVQATDFEAGENTFGTANQDVFLNPATGKFSDTPTVGYYKIGQLASGGTKDASGMIVITKRRWAEPIESDET